MKLFYVHVLSRVDCDIGLPRQLQTHEKFGAGVRVWERDVGVQIHICTHTHTYMAMAAAGQYVRHVGTMRGGGLPMSGVYE